MHAAAGRPHFLFKADYYALLIKQRDCSKHTGDEVQIDQPAGRRRKIIISQTEDLISSCVFVSVCAVFRQPDDLAAACICAEVG